MREGMVSVPCSLTIVAFDGNKVSGWALVAETPEGNHVNLFVSRNYRRQGVAAELLRHVLTLVGGVIIVAKWDSVSKIFFDKLGQKYPDRVLALEWSNKVKNRFLRYIRAC